MKTDHSTKGTCREFATNLLWQVPSIFGRLVFLASRRDPASGRYTDPLMAGVFQEDTVHRALAQLHSETFQTWAGFNQGQQRRDLLRYLEAGDGSLRNMVNIWINSNLSARLVPFEIEGRQEFIRALAVLLILISIEQP